MPERQIKIVISGEDRTKKTLASVQSRFTAVGKKMMGVGAKMTLGLTAPIVALGIKTAKMAGDFEAQMNIMAIAARSSGTSLEELEKAAIATGADIGLVGIDAVQAADAMTSMYKAGLTTADMFGGPLGLNRYIKEGTNLTGALRAAIDLAAASDLDLAAATDAVIVGMSTYGIGAEEATRVSDNLVAAADASVAEVSELAAAMTAGGPVMASFGYELEDVNTGLAILSMRGIKGELAGRGLRSMMNNLMRPTKQVKNQLRALNISLYDQEGALKALPMLVGELSEALVVGAKSTIQVNALTEIQGKQLGKLQDKYATLVTHLTQYQEGIRGTTLSDKARGKAIARTQEKMNLLRLEMEPLLALETKVTNQTREFTQAMRDEAIVTLAGTFGQTAMNTLLKEGVSGWQDMETAIGQAATAQEVAAERTKGFNAMIEALTGMVQTFMITAGKPLIETILMPIVEKVQEIVQWLLNLDPKWVRMGVVILGVIAAAGPLITIFGVILTVLGAILSPIGLIIAAVVALGAAFIKSQGGFQGALDTLRDIWAVIQGYLAPVVERLAIAWENIKNAFAEGGLGAAFQAALTEIGGLWDSLKEKAITEWGPKLWAALTAVWGNLKEKAQADWGPKLWAALTSIWENLKEKAITEWGPRLWEALTTTWAGLKEKATTEWGPKLWEALTTTWDGLKEKATEWGPKLWAALTVAWENLKEKAKTEWGPKLWEALTTAWSTVKEKAVEWGLKLWAALTIAWDTVKNKAAEWGDKLWAALTAAWDTVDKKAAEWGSRLSAAIGKAWDSLPDKAAEWGAKLGPAISAAVTSAITWLRENLGPFALKLGTALGELLSKAEALFLAKSGEIGKGIGKAIGTIIRVGIGLLVGQIVALATLLFNFLKGVITGSTKMDRTAMNKALLDFFGGLLDGLMIGLTGDPQWAKKLGDFFIGLWDDVKTWAGEIATKIEGVGTAIVDGIIKGIENAWGGLTGMFTGLISGLPEWARKLLGAKSPSKVFEDIGMDIMLGWAKGIDKGEAKVIEKISKAMVRFTESLSALVDLRKALGGEGAPFAGVGTFIEQFKVIGVQIVAAIKFIEDSFSYNVIKKLQNTAKRVKVMMEVVIRDFSDIKLIELPDMLAWRNQIVEIMHHVVRALQIIRDEFRHWGLEAAAKTAEYAQKIVAFIVPMIDAITAMTTYEPVESIEANMTNFAERLKEVVTKLVETAQTFGLAGMRAASDLYAAMSGVLAVVKPGIDAVKALFEYEKAEELLRLATDFGVDINTVAAALESVANIAKTEAMEAASALYNALSGIFSIIKPGIDAIKDLFEYEKQTGLLQRATDFGVNINTIAAGLESVANVAQTTAMEAASALYSAMAGMLAIIKPGIDAVKELFEYESKVGLLQRAIDFGVNINTIAAGLESVANIAGTEAMDAASKLYSAMSGVLSIVKPGLDAIKELFEYEKTEGLLQLAKDFGADIASIAEGLKQAAKITAIEAMEAAAKFYQAAQDVIGIVKPTIAAIVAMLEYEGGDIPTAMTLFKADLMTMLGPDGLPSVTFAMEEGFESAKKFKTAASKITDTLNVALEMFQGLTSTEAGGYLYNLEEWHRTFMHWVGQVTARMGTQLGNLVTAIWTAKYQIHAAIESMRPDFEQWIAWINAVGGSNPGIVTRSPAPQFAAGGGNTYQTNYTITMQGGDDSVGRMQNYLRMVEMGTMPA